MEKVLVSGDEPLERSRWKDLGDLLNFLADFSEMEKVLVPGDAPLEKPRRDVSRCDTSIYRTPLGCGKKTAIVPIQRGLRL